MYNYDLAAWYEKINKLWGTFWNQYKWWSDKNTC